MGEKIVGMKYGNSLIIEAPPPMVPLIGKYVQFDPYMKKQINQLINLFKFASFYIVLYIHYNILNTMRHKLGLYQR